MILGDLRALHWYP